MVLHHCWLATWALLVAQGRDFPIIAQQIDQFVGLFRMPAFFFCSGLVFAGPMTRGWRWFLSVRVGFAVWVIPLWTLLGYLVLKSGVDFFPWVPQIDETLRWSWFFWVPFGHLWFLYAVTILGALAMALRLLPLVVSCAIAAALMVLLILLNGRIDLPFGLQTLHFNLAARGILFFLVGVGAARWLRRPVKTSAAGVLAAVAVLALLGLVLLMGWYGTIWQRIVLSLPGTFASVYLLIHLCNTWPALAAGLGKIGNRSIELFLLHRFALILPFYLFRDVLPGAAWWSILPGIFAATLVLSLPAAAGLRRLPGNPFFTMPRVFLRKRHTHPAT